MSSTAAAGAAEVAPPMRRGDSANAVPQSHVAVAVANPRSSCWDVRNAGWRQMRRFLGCSHCSPALPPRRCLGGWREACQHPLAGASEILVDSLVSFAFAHFLQHALNAAHVLCRLSCGLAHALLPPRSASSLSLFTLPPLHPRAGGRAHPLRAGRRSRLCALQGVQAQPRVGHRWVAGNVAWRWGAIHCAAHPPAAVQLVAPQPCTLLALPP